MSEPFPPLTAEELDRWQAELTPEHLARIAELLPEYITEIWVLLARSIADVARYRTALRAIADIQAGESAMRVYRIASQALGAD